MSALWPVSPALRERISREFDDRGPEACMTEIIEDLRRNNPELLDMAANCAGSVGNYSKAMRGFGMFYRLLLAAAAPDGQRLRLYPLPRVTPQTRDLIVQNIDLAGAEAFTIDAIQALSRDNPELLQMAHSFADEDARYLTLMQGFALLYKSLVEQFAGDTARLH